MGPKLYFGFYFDMPAITMVINKAQRMLKFKPIDFAVGLEGNVSLVHCGRNAYPEPDYAFEDALIAAAPPAAFSAPDV